MYFISDGDISQVDVIKYLPVSVVFRYEYKKQVEALNKQIQHLNWLLDKKK